MKKGLRNILKAVNLVVVFITIISLLASCGSAGSNQQAAASSTHAGDASTAVASTAGGNEPKSAEQRPEFSKHHEVTIKYVSPGISGPDNEKDLVAAEIEKQTNLRIKYEALGETSNDYQQKINLMVASGDVPDVLGLYPGDFERNALRVLGKSGKIWDIAPYIKNYNNLYNLLKNELYLYKDKVNNANWFVPANTMKGQTSKYNMPQLLWLRDDFIKKLNMPYPTTTDELYVYLKRCKDEIKEVAGKPVIGLLFDENLGGYDANIGSYFDWFIPRMFYPLVSEQAPGGGGILYPSAFGIDTHDNNKIYNYLYTDSDVLMRAAKYINKLYREGLIDKDIATIKRTQYEEKASSGRVAALAGWNWDASAFTANSQKIDPEASFVAPPVIFDKLGGCPKYPNDKWATAVTPNNIWFISKKLNEETMKHLLAVCDYLATKDGQILLQFGIEGKTFNYDSNHKIIYTDEFKKMTDNLDAQKMNQYGVNYWQWALVSYPSSIVDMYDVISAWRPQDVKGLQNQKAYMDLFDPGMKLDKTYFILNGPKQVKKASALNQAKLEMYVKVLTAKSDSEVEQIVHNYGKVCKDLGIDEIVAEKQKIIDELVLPEN